MSTKLSTLPPEEVDALVTGVHADPFSRLGFHSGEALQTIRCFIPLVDEVVVVDKAGKRFPMQQAHASGLYEVTASRLPCEYMFELSVNESSRMVFDPYSYQTLLGEVDHHLLSEGNHEQLFSKLGSHLVEIGGVTGVYFAVWAPNASVCSVIGDFNEWDERRHVMRKHHASGIWEIFIPAAGSGSGYKYALRDSEGQALPHKNDPYAQYFEAPPGNASIVYDSHYEWHDSDWQTARKQGLLLDKPVSIYEVHLASWRHKEFNTPFSYRELVDHLIPYARDNGFTHLELMPITEHPFSGSWGYQPIGMFAPTQRLGNPDDFRYFVDQCHEAGLGVIMDWVPAHFPADDHGLANFDGTHLYEHADPRQGIHKDWDTLIYNFGRNEVSNYLLCNALFWIKEFHLDGLRVDAVASMLYLDYSREDGEWIPNEEGGNHNLQAVVFLQKLNELVHRAGAITMAEESTSWDGVSRPVYAGGLGFTYKWNMGWMHDILEYMSLDPVHRKHHHQRLTFGLIYAFSENFVLPISHDEVVYGKYSLLGKMPGDEWQSFANLRCLYGFMYGYPGKKLLFMGNEIAQKSEWSHDSQLQWELLGDSKHQQTLLLVAALNNLYRTEPALHAGDCDPLGFQWIDCDDAEHSVVAFYRRVPGSAESIIFICNFTPVVRQAHRLGVYDKGVYVEILNTDDALYGGGGVMNPGSMQTDEISVQDKDHSLSLTLPPLAVTVLKREATC